MNQLLQNLIAAATAFNAHALGADIDALLRQTISDRGHVLITDRHRAPPPLVWVVAGRPVGRQSPYRRVSGYGVPRLLPRVWRRRLPAPCFAAVRCPC